jgi:hypothetical protein
MLETLGLATRAKADEMPAELRASVRGVEQPEYWQFSVDEVVGAWMQALGTQAKSGGEKPAGKSTGAATGKAGTRKRTK